MLKVAGGSRASRNMFSYFPVFFPGEKPYECCNCKKRFSHSGSYSSHISSRKCAGPIGLHRRPQRVGSAAKPAPEPRPAPTPARLRHKLEKGRVQYRLDVRSETTDRLMTASHRRPGGPKGPGVFADGLGSQSRLGNLSVNFLLLGTPESLNDARQMRRQTMDEVSKPGAYTKELGARTEEKNLRGSFADDSHDTPESADRAKVEPDQNKQQKTRESILSKDGSRSVLYSCQFCKETCPGPIPLHQHERYLCKMNEDIQAVLQPAGLGPGLESSEWPVSTREPGASPGIPFEDHSSLTPTNWNTQADSEELVKISLAVGLPQDFVWEWFAQRNGGPPAGGGSDPRRIWRRSPESSNGDAYPGQFTTKSPGDGTPDPLEHSGRSPLNLSSSSSKHSQSSSYAPNSPAWEDLCADIPLDLSVPKNLWRGRAKKNGSDGPEPKSGGNRDPLHVTKEFPDCEGGRNCRRMEKRPTFGINPSTGRPAYLPAPPHGTLPPAMLLPPARYPHPDSGIGFTPRMAYAYASGGAAFADVARGGERRWKTALQVSDF